MICKLTSSSVVPAPDKNPENIRVEASEPNEMVMKWEVRKCVCQCYNTGNRSSLRAAVSKDSKFTRLLFEYDCIKKEIKEIMDCSALSPLPLSLFFR